jgi:hypothetical protein
VTYASKEVDLELLLAKTKCMLSRYMNAGQNHDMKVPYRSFENVAHFGYLGKTVD